jgi:hypothetical protein
MKDPSAGNAALMFNRSANPNFKILSTVFIPQFPSGEEVYMVYRILESVGVN